MKSKLMKILREIGWILFCAVSTVSVLVIVSSPFWWNLPDQLVARLLLTAVLAFVVIYAAASLHSEYKLVVRVERRVK